MNRLVGVEVSNYQSIGEADVTFGGLTVIVGRGNLGKSALLRAITAALFNETGTDFIRRGTKKAQVSLVFEGDQVVTWVKDEKTARYEADIAGAKMDFTKLNGNVPSELQDLFGIRTIEIDSTFSMRPQIHGQFDMPILLTESASKAARALGKLTKLEVVLQAQSAAAKDLRKVKQDVTARKREVEELTQRLDTYPDVEKIDERLKAAQAAVKAADNRLNDLAAAEEAYELMLDAKRRLKLEPPTLNELGGLSERLNTLQNVLIARQVYMKCLMAVEDVADARKIADADLERAAHNLDVLMQTLSVCPVCGQPMGDDHDD